MLSVSLVAAMVLLRKELLSSNNKQKLKQQQLNKSLCVHKHIHANKNIEYLYKNNKHERKTCITTLIFNRSQKASIEAQNANLQFRERLLIIKGLNEAIIKERIS